eukprot:gene20939-25652_t
MPSPGPALASGHRGGGDAQNRLPRKRARGAGEGPPPAAAAGGPRSKASVLERLKGDPSYDARRSEIGATGACVHTLPAGQRGRYPRETIHKRPD